MWYDLEKATQSQLGPCLTTVHGFTFFKSFGCGGVFVEEVEQNARQCKCMPRRILRRSVALFQVLLRARLVFITTRALSHQFIIVCWSKKKRCKDVVHLKEVNCVYTEHLWHRVLSHAASAKWTKSIAVDLCVKPWELSTQGALRSGFAVIYLQHLLSCGIREYKQSV